jgi:hypothetical protein
VLRRIPHSPVYDVALQGESKLFGDSLSARKRKVTDATQRVPTGFWMRQDGLGVPGAFSPVPDSRVGWKGLFSLSSKSFSETDKTLSVTNQSFSVASKTLSGAN